MTSYSGDWKMRIQPTAAKLLNADVLMLNWAYEPLGYERHEWLDNWREAIPGSIMCTHFVNFQDSKTENLRGHKGQLLDTVSGEASRKKAYCKISTSPWRSLPRSRAIRRRGESHRLEKHMQRPPTDYIMWRFAENDDRESLGFKTDELLVDEATARASKWCIDSVSGNDRRRTDLKETPRDLTRRS